MTLEGDPKEEDKRFYSNGTVTALSFVHAAVRFKGLKFNIIIVLRQMKHCAPNVDLIWGMPHT